MGRARAASRPESGIAIVGPTATGKSELAVVVAERLGGEIVSVDSRQAYRGLEIGTAAPTPEQRRRVPHHGVAFLEPGERWSAGRFARRARQWISGIRARSRVPVLAGGTGFFLAALTDPPFREPDMDPERRERLERWLSGLDEAELRRWTRRLDPELERELGTLDPQRCARTLELALLAGRPVTWWHRNGAPEAEPLRFLVFGLELPGELHRERIRRRTEALLEAGWPEEVRRLLGEGRDPDQRALSALGYDAVAALVRGERGREEVLEEIVRDTWHYARRQRTWFRHQLPEGTVRLDARRPVDQLADRVTEAWEEERRRA
ncbi:MAG TPA: tRNA (adenosine(37)-N6)-dimethylallyltransferase MiaA [Gemmatimonadota bacterium]|nr:tRNA (adenosine(37)-N6)-dimethylallyltransferase MiaA [Gemmatimonadota bacterium]